MTQTTEMPNPPANSLMSADRYASLKRRFFPDGGFSDRPIDSGESIPNEKTYHLSQACHTRMDHSLIAAYIAASLLDAHKTTKPRNSSFGNLETDNATFMTPARDLFEWIGGMPRDISEEKEGGGLTEEIHDLHLDVRHKTPDHYSGRLKYGGRAKPKMFLEEVLQY